jgi:allantoinase
MTTLANSPTTLLFHAEMIPPITDSVGDGVQTSLPPMAPHGPLDSYSTFLSSRPPAFETYAIEEILSLAHLAPKLQLHIVHLSAIECIPLLRNARAKGTKISAETCFHYLALAAEDVVTGDTRHKCCPPIRDSVNREGLWAELSSPGSVIETIVSDHSPCTPELKLLPDHVLGSNNSETSKKDEKGDFFASWGGISSVGLGLPILWTSSHSSSTLSFSGNSHSHVPTHPQSPKLSILDVVKLCCVNTAIQVGLQHKKGAISPGMDADICVFDDEGFFTVEQTQMLFRNKVTPYQGKKLRGVVLETYLRGRSIYTRNDGFADEKPKGELLLEKRKF